MSHVRLGHFSGHTNELLEAFDRAAARRQAGAYRELAGDEAMLVDFTSGPLKDLLDALSDFRRCQVRGRRAARHQGVTPGGLRRQNAA